jgi:acetyltransferase-like isoleucine patch superfamily enzyme
MSTWSVIDSACKIGKDVKIGNFCKIYGNVEIGDRTIVGDYCTLGHPSQLAEGKALIIGKDSLIRSHSIFYEGSVLGDRLVTGHRVTVREKTYSGVGLQLGTLCDIQGHCEIGDHVRFHSSVHVGQKTKLHNYIWIFPYTVLTNDPHPPSDGFLSGVEVFDFAVIAAMCCILPGIKIGENSLVGAQSLVVKDVEPRTVVAGVPAKFKCETSEIKLRDGSGKSAYPWTTHFHRGYPQEIVKKWLRKGNK